MMTESSTWSSGLGQHPDHLGANPATGGWSLNVAPIHRESLATWLSGLAGEELEIATNAQRYGECVALWCLTLNVVAPRPKVPEDGERDR